MIRAVIVLALLAALTYATRSFLPAGTTLTGSGAALATGFLLLAALQTGHIFHALRLPHLTGFILCGLVFGPEVLGLVTPAMLKDLTLVKKVAVGLIALTAGAELNFRALRPKLRAIGMTSLFGLLGASLLTAAALYGLSFLVPALAGCSFSDRVILSLVCAVVLAALSPSVVMGILSESRAAGPVSETCLSIVVLADLGIAMGFALVDSFARKSLGLAAPGGNVIGELAVHIFGSLVVGAGVGAVCALFVRRVGRRVGLFIFAVSFVVAEAGSALHLDPLLVGLAAGLFLENISPIGGAQVIHDTEPAAAPTFAVFFAVIGCEIHLHAFLAVAPFAIAAAVARGTGMVVGARIGARMGGVPKEIARHLPFGMLPQAGIAIGLANLVKTRYGPYGDALGNLLLGAVVVNEMLGPVLFRGALARAGEIDKKPHGEPLVAHGAAAAPETEPAA